MNGEWRISCWWTYRSQGVVQCFGCLSPWLFGTPHREVPFHEDAPQSLSRISTEGEQTGLFPAHVESSEPWHKSCGIDEMGESEVVELEGTKFIAEEVYGRGHGGAARISCRGHGGAARISCRHDGVHVSMMLFVSCCSGRRSSEGRRNIEGNKYIPQARRLARV